MSVTAARSVLWSTTAVRAAIPGRLTAGLKPKATSASSPFRMPKQNPLSQRIFRSPVELSCCVETMLPFHTATASALLTSKLSVSRRSYGWTSEDFGYKSVFELKGWTKTDGVISDIHIQIAMMMYDECQRVREKLLYMRSKTKMDDSCFLDAVQRSQSP